MEICCLLFGCSCGTVLCVLYVLRLCAEVVMAVWSMHWGAWCLVMDGEGGRLQVMHVDDGGYVEGYWFRI